MLIILNMARPKKYRKIKCNPAVLYFKPRGIPMSVLDEVILEPDELEADLNKLKKWREEFVAR